MRHFISYAHSDGDWVHQLYSTLQEFHQPWIDERLLPAQDWWNTILLHIRDSDCLIFVMTPDSVKSIYCQTEVSYALDLNVPVLPLVLKPCDYPAMLKAKGIGRIQYRSVRDVQCADHVIAHSLIEVISEIGRHHYDRRSVPVPDEPKPKGEEASETIGMAEEAYRANNSLLAEKLFQQAISSDPERWIPMIVQVLGKYGKNYSPNNIVERERGDLLSGYLVILGIVTSFTFFLPFGLLGVLRLWRWKKSGLYYLFVDTLFAPGLMIYGVILNISNGTLDVLNRDSFLIKYVLAFVIVPFMAFGILWLLLRDKWHLFEGKPHTILGRKFEF